MRLFKAFLSKGKGRRRLGWASAVLLFLISGCISSGLAGRVTKANLAQRIATATTAADHEALAAYFRKKAAEMAAEQVRHERAIINSYTEAAASGDVGPSRARIRKWMRDHCRELIESYRRVQENYLQLAEDHARMARELAAGK